MEKAGRAYSRIPTDQMNRYKGSGSASAVTKKYPNYPINGVSRNAH
jgi:hypothetical protein